MPFLALLPLLASGSAVAARRGDVSLDGVVDPADVLLLSRYLRGDLLLDDEALDAADVAPLMNGSIAPDQEVHIGDLAVLVRAIRGDVNLPSGPAKPTLDGQPPPNSNPVTLTGTADPNATLSVYVNGELAKDAQCNFTAGSTYQCQVVALFDGTNTLKVVARIGSETSPASDPLILTYNDTSFRGGFSAAECDPNPPPCDPDPIAPGTTVVWGPGQPYKISSFFKIPTSGPSNATLIILRQTELQFATNAGLDVLATGTLLVRGRSSTSADPEENYVHFGPQEGVSGEGKWQGIRVASTGNVIELARLDDSETAIELVSAAQVEILDSTIVRFSREGILLGTNSRAEISRNVIDDKNSTDPGIKLNGANSASTHIHDNELRNCSRGIDSYDTSATIRANLIKDNAIGITLNGASSPHIEENTVTGSCIGIWVRQGASGGLVPFPVVTSNSIYNNSGNGTGGCSGGLLTNYVIDNSVSNYAPGTILDAEDNWWGTPDPLAAASGILDHTDRPEAPIVDFIPLLDAPHDSVPAPHSIGDGQYLVGVSNDSLLPLSPGDYDVVGTLVVPDANTWTVPAGVHLSMLAGTGLEVFGTLFLLGSSGDPISMLSMEPVPAAGDWRGISVSGASAAATIDHAIIHDAESAVSVSQGYLEISNSDLQDFQSFGITATDALSGSIVDNLIGPGPGSGQGVGVELIDSYLDVLGNTIQNLSTGVRVTGTSSILIGRSPTSGNGNTISGNTWGIDLKGSPSGDPTPIVNDNNLFANSSGNLRTRNFSPGGSGILDAQRNWWGTPILADIRATIVHDALNPILVNVSNYLDGPDGTQIGGTAFSHLISNVNRSTDFITPTEATNQQVDITFTTPTTADLTVEIYQEQDDGLTTVLRTLTQLARPEGLQTLSWDGADSSGVPVPPDAYIFRVLADDGSVQDEYNPPRPGSVTVTSVGSLYTDPIAPQRNEFFKVLYNHQGDPARTKVHVKQTAGASFDALGLTNLPFPVRNGNLFVYNGRGADGRSFIQSVTGNDLIVSVDAVAALKPNFVIVEKTNPQIRGPEFESPPPAIPNVEIRANPYRLRESYDQITTLRFELDRDACVKIRILEPDFADPVNPATDVIATILDAELAPGTHEARWLDDPAHGLASSDATYTFLVEATSKVGASCVDTLKTTYLGVVQVRR